MNKKIWFYSRVFREIMPVILSQTMLLGEHQCLVYSMFKRVNKHQLSMYCFVFHCLAFVILL